MKRFCGVMDFPPPVSQSSHNLINLVSRDKTREVAEASMTAAIEEEVKELSW